MTKRQILAVGDDPEIAMLAGTVAELEGHQVSLVRDPAAALTLLSDSCTPDLILLDLMMPVASDCAFMRALWTAADQRRIPILGLSGVPVVCPPALGVPTAEHVVNAFDCDALRNGLRHFLGKPNELSSA